MDLALFFRVVWRFRALVASGLVLALALSFLAFVRVDFGDGFKMSYRQAEQWESLSTLFVTTPDFALGGLEGTTDSEASTAAADRVTSLASLYMQLATTDPVLRIMARNGPVDGVLQTFPVTSTGDPRGEPLPMVTLSAVSSSPGRAQALARRHVAAFLEYLRRDQEARGIAPRDRVKVDVVRQPQPAVLMQPRKKTLPVFVFLAVAIAVLGLAFVLENLRPRVRVLPDEAQGLPGERARRTA